MKISPLHQQDYENYTHLNNEFGNVFSSLKWLAVQQEVNIYGIYNKNDELIGGFHLLETKKWGIKIVRDGWFTPYIGPIFKSDAEKNDAKIEFEQKIISLLAKFIQRKKSQ